MPKEKIMKWASAISTKDLIDSCIEETSKAVMDQLGGKAAHLTVIFISPHFIGVKIKLLL